MIEVTIVFKDGIQTHLTLNVTFEDLEDEVETKSKIGFISYNDFSERIPPYMNILGRLLKKQAKRLWEEMNKDDGEITDLRLWIPEVQEDMFEEEQEE